MYKCISVVIGTTLNSLTKHIWSEEDGVCVLMSCTVSLSSTEIGVKVMSYNFGTIKYKLKKLKCQTVIFIAFIVCQLMKLCEVSFLFI